MKYVQLLSFIDIIGHIWQSNMVAGNKYNLDDNTVKLYVAVSGTITRDDVQRFINTQVSDFF